MTHWRRRPDGWPLCPNCGRDGLWARGFRRRDDGKAHIGVRGLECRLCGYLVLPGAPTDEALGRVVPVSAGEWVAFALGVVSLGIAAWKVFSQ